MIDSIVSGVRTTEEIDAEPYGFRVGWIGWNSGFRGTDLKIGDRVIACEGVRYERDKRKEFNYKAFGAHSENQYWQQAGAKDGQTVTVTVIRGSTIVDVTGQVRAERNYQNDNGRMTIGPDGPDRLANDGFSGPWMGWLEKFEDFGSRVLDGGWRRGTVSNSRQMLANHRDQKARVDFLVQHYPGPFASAVAQDWETVRAALEGPRYEISDRDLAWRSLGDQRKASVAATAKAAREAFLKSIAAQTIEPFPSIDPIRGDRASVAGKIVRLPPLRNRDWVMDAGRSWLTVRRSDGCYFVDTESPRMRRAFLAGWRYQKAVAPSHDETYEVIGRIGPNPKMLAIGGVAVPGLLVEPVAVTVGDAFFVDVTSDAARFAGEDDLIATAEPALDATAPPDKVMETFVLALKLGDEGFWRSLFAPWDASRADGRAWYKPLSGPASSNSLASEWIRARRVVEKSVFDVRVVAIDPIATVIAPADFDGAPHIERTIVEVDHVGLFDGEYRPFKDVNVNRLWPMQRRNGGPWRIAIDKGV